MSRKKSGKKKGNTGGIILETVGILILVLAVLACIPLTIPRALGYQIYAAIDFNYGPEVSEGSLVYVEQYVGEDLVKDDMVAYYSAAGTGVSLRLVEENHFEEKTLDVTDGWGNGETVSYSQVMGRAVAIIPVLGRILSFVASVAGAVTVAVMIALAVFLTFFGSRMRQRGEKQIR